MQNFEENFMRESRSQSPERDDRKWYPPGQFKNYILEKEIDGGGMGIVYKARTIKDQKPVAIKFLLDSSQYKRFRREIDAGQCLQHPNFVRFHDTGEIDDHFYIVMDFIEGQPLKKYMEKVNLSPERRLEIFYTIVAAVGYAHSLGLIHRDLKPGNILINQQEEPIILDFGLAKYIKKQDDVTALTIEGQILGTPGYMSPEQARGEVENQDERTDVFCLGIILYEMLSARNPFDGSNFLEVCYNIAHKSPAPIEQFVPGIPAKLAYIVNKALARSQDLRYQNAQEFAQELYSFLIFRQKGKQGDGYPSMGEAEFSSEDSFSAEADTVPPMLPSSEQYPIYSSSKGKPGTAKPNTGISGGLPPTPPGANKVTERVKKILCTYCETLNSPMNERCQECGQSLKPAMTEENRPRIRQDKTSTPNLGYTAPKDSKKVRIQPARHNVPYARPVPAKTPATGRIVRPMPLAPLEKEEKNDVKNTEKTKENASFFYIVLVAIGLTISLFPAQRELHAPWYASVLDIALGSACGFILGKYAKNGLYGSLFCFSFASVSFILKSLMHIFSRPNHGETALEVIQALFLASLFGFIIGLFKKKQEETHKS